MNEPERQSGYTGADSDNMVVLLYEDDDVVAVDKPAGIAAIPERKKGVPNMLERVIGHRMERLWVVHRIDKPVSGVLLFARSEEAHRSLNLAFSSRLAKKTYLALVHGNVRDRQGRVTLPVRQFGSGRMGVDHHRGKECVTDFRVLAAGEQYSVIEMHPVTGRRHQLRVHAYALGHPIVGDLLYGEKDMQRGYDRLLLHAARLQLPSGKRILDIRAPVPGNFSDMVEALTGFAAVLS